MRRLLLPLLALLVPVTLVGLVKTAERRHWAAMRDEAAVVESRLRATPRDRESIVGETTDGRAWEHYDVALASVRARGPAVRDIANLTRALTLDDETARGERARWLADWSAELEEVRRGARARDVTPTIDWELGLNNRLPSLMSARLLTALLVADGVRHLEAARPDEAVQRFLTAMQLGHDLLDHPLAIVAAIGSDAVVPEPLLDLLAERGLAEFDAPSLDALDAGLAQLDASWPRSMTFLEAETLLFVHHLQSVEASTGGLDMGTMFGESLWVWRYCGSTRAGLSDGVRTSLELADRLGPDPVRVPLATLDALAEEVEQHPNPVVRVFWSAPMRSMLDARREAAVRLRSLRHALALARGLPAPAIDDPLGLATTVTQEDGCVVVRTPRRSGRDPIEVRVRR